MENQYKRKEPRKSWYWVPFIGAILITIFSVSQFLDMKTPFAGFWTPADTSSLFKSFGWSVITVIVFILQGINGLYHYRMLKGDDDEDS